MIHHHDHAAQGHSHVDESGQIVKCYHECKNQVTTLSFWILMTVSFPFEHAIWEYGIPFIIEVVKNAF